MRPCQAAPALATKISTPPKAAATASKAACTEAASVTSHCTGKCSRTDRLGLLARRGEIEVEQRDFRAGRGERLRGRGADGARGAGDDGNLAGQRRLLADAELGLLQRPIFDVEHVGLGDRLEAADAFRAGDDSDPFLGDVGGNDRVAFGAAQTKKAEPRNQDNTGQGIELVLDPADTMVVMRKIVAVALGEIARRLARRGGEVIKLTRLRRRQNQRPVLGANGVIGRHHARLAQARQIVGVDECLNAFVAAKIQHQPSPCAFDVFVSFTARAAHDRRDFGK